MLTSVPQRPGSPLRCGERRSGVSDTEAEDEELDRLAMEAVTVVQAPEMRPGGEPVCVLEGGTRGAPLSRGRCSRSDGGTPARQ